jgi:hypothetical protein
MELDTTELFEGEEINGKRFPFIYLTVTESANILKKLLPSFRHDMMNIFSRSGTKKRWWKKVRSFAFQKTGMWKWFGIIPKELCCSIISTKKADEIEDHFFVYAEVIVQEYERLLSLSNPSLIANRKKKENV